MDNRELPSTTRGAAPRGAPPMPVATYPAFRFFAVPAHELDEHPRPLASQEVLEPELPYVFDAIDRALTGAEFRDMRARDRVRSVLSSDAAPRHASPGTGFGPAAVFASSPADLGPLLRLADQLEQLAAAEVGERALVWRCDGCHTRYAVPVALVRRVTIRCERCAGSVELAEERSLGEEALLEPTRATVNHIRRQLAQFFREAMARGWPVLVAASEPATRPAV